MSLLYVHLSDIHFGQEKGGQVFVNDDVKEQILIDAHDVVGKLQNGKANGIIISGDIAYAGKENEYKKAGQWLDRLTAAVGCELTAVQVVPGNHDIDRDYVSNITQEIINKIIAGGDEELDRYLESEQDREVLYKRFTAYRKFAEAYDCPLDNDGGILRHRTIEIAPYRRIKFLGVNTALICSKNKEEEKAGLLLGQRQRVLGMEMGLELVVIAHHPLHCLQDSEDALKYIRNRARVFISGHEHLPSSKVDPVSEEADLLVIASGATVPPKPDDRYNYCYNILELEWEKDTDDLRVSIYGRIWDDDKKAFTTDKVHFNDGKETHILKCPNFKKLAVTCNVSERRKIDDEHSEENFESRESGQHSIEYKVTDKEYQLVLLRFFRDITSAQRLSILVQLGALPNDWSEPLTHILERRALDSLNAKGRSDEIRDLINKILSPPNRHTEE